MPFIMSTECAWTRTWIWIWGMHSAEKTHQFILHMCLHVCDKLSAQSRRVWKRGEMSGTGVSAPAGWLVPPLPSRSLSKYWSSTDLLIARLLWSDHHAAVQSCSLNAWSRLNKQLHYFNVQVWKQCKLLCSLYKCISINLLTFDSA